MINENKSPERIEGKNKIFNNTIITPNSNDNFLVNDWKNSGISDETINRYISEGYLKATFDGWELTFPELFENKKSNYWTKRLKEPKESKYIRPKGETSRLFRPLEIAPECLNNADDYVIVVEGEKKSIKAAQEGFNCIAVVGVWCFRGKTKDGLIPDMHKINWKNKTVYLCFDTDVKEKQQVKQALCAFVEVLQDKGAIVKDLDLTLVEEFKNYGK
jgi:hypothetical protein